MLHNLCSSSIGPIPRPRCRQVYWQTDEVWEIFFNVNNFSLDPIGEEFLNEYGFTEIEADFSAKTMTLCKIKLLSKSFRSYLIDKIAKKCANRYRNANNIWTSIRDVRTRAARRSQDSVGNFMSADSNDSVGLIEMVMLLQNCSKNENEIIDPVSFW